MAFPLAALASVGGQALSGMGGAASAGAAGVAGGLSSLTGALSKGASGLLSFGGLLNPLNAFASAFATSGPGAASSLTGLSSAAGALGGKFTEIVNFASRFVQAIDPNIIAELNRAFRDLDAVIGVALRPVILAAVSIVRNFAASIFEAMIRLQPIVEKVANTIATALQPAFDALGTVIEGLMPVFDVIADALIFVATLFSDLANFMRPLINVIVELGRQLFATIAALFGVESIGGGLKSLFDEIRSALQEFLKAIILVTATVARFLGASKVLDAIIKGLQPKERKDATGAAVAEGAQFKSIESLGRDVYLKAFQASTYGKGEEPKKAEDFLAGILTQVQDIASGKSTLDDLPQVIRDVSTNIIAVGTLIQGLVQWVQNRFPSTTLGGDTNAKAKEQKAQGNIPQYTAEDQTFDLGQTLWDMAMGR